MGFAALLVQYQGSQFVLMAPHGVIFFLYADSERIPSGSGQEKIGFRTILFLTVDFPPVFDMGGGFEECKNNIFSVGESWTKKYPSR